MDLPPAHALRKLGRFSSPFAGFLEFAHCSGREGLFATGVHDHEISYSLDPRLYQKHVVQRYCTQAALGINIHLMTPARMCPRTDVHPTAVRRITMIVV